MDALSDPETETVVAETSSQVGKTELLNNAAGYFSHWEPSPILTVQPTIEMGESWSKDRLAPMIRDSDVLRELYPDPRSRTSGNTLRHKTFPGGHITVIGANAPAGLAMRPIRVLLGDEIDRWPVSSGTEGDPLRLAMKRQQTYWNRVALLASSPTIKGHSRIHAWYLRGSQEICEVPCGTCGHFQRLRWEQVKWDTGPGSARYVCESCDAEWSDAERLQALEGHRWIAQNADAGRRIRSFHLSELYSPWSSLERMVATFLEVKDSPSELQVWINTALAELWEGDGETLPAEELWQTHRQELAELPDYVSLLTAGVDVQLDRLELEIVGWDPATRSSASLLYHVIYGDPRIPVDRAGSPWTELKTLLLEKYHGRAIRAAFVDAGYLFEDVLRFCKPLGRRGIYASRGEAGHLKPWIVGSSRNNALRARVFRLGVDRLKAAVYHYLRVEVPGEPGFWAFPEDREIDYFEGLTAERVVTRYRMGHPVPVWELPAGARNEPLDCRAYALAALERVKPRRLAIIAPSRAAVAPPSEVGDPDFRGFDETGDWIR